MAFEDKFNIKYLVKNKNLCKPDYNEICRIIKSALFPFRVTSIRKELEFKSSSYDEYINENNIVDLELPSSDEFGNSMIAIEFESEIIDMVFVPELMDEYYVPNTIPGLPHDKRFMTGDRTPDDMLILDSGRYRSLVFAGYEINKYLNEAIKCSRTLKNIAEDVVYSVIFYGSTNEANPTIKVGVTINLLI